MKIKKFVFALCLLGLIFPVYAETGRDLQPANSNRGPAWGDLVVACTQYQLNSVAMTRSNSSVVDSIVRVSKNGTDEEKQVAEQIILSILESYRPMQKIGKICTDYMDKVLKK